MEHQIELTAESLWSEVAGRLRGSLNDTTYGTWFGEVTGLELSDACFVLGVPNDFTRDWIEGHFPRPDRRGDPRRDRRRAADRAAGQRTPRPAARSCWTRTAASRRPSRRRS